MKENDKTKAFLDMVCSKVRGYAARKAVRRDLAEHIEDKIADIMKEKGEGFDQAEAEAVNGMGAARDIARSINAVNRFSWYNILKYVMLAASIVVGLLAFQSSLYPSESQTVSEYVKDGVYYAVATATGGIHAPSMPLLVLTMAMAAATTFLFAYSSVRTKTIYSDYKGGIR